MFILDVKSGFIGKEILREKLFDAERSEIPQTDEVGENNIYNFNINESIADETYFEQGTIGDYSTFTT